MSAAFTPGPWKTMAANPALVTGGNPSFLIANCMNGRGVVGNGQDEANAQLIAAAPELLEALINLMSKVSHDGWSKNDPHSTAARAAIAKATGSAK